MFLFICFYAMKITPLNALDVDEKEEAFPWAGLGEFSFHYYKPSILVSTPLKDNQNGLYSYVLTKSNIES